MVRQWELDRWDVGRVGVLPVGSHSPPSLSSGSHVLWEKGNCGEVAREKWQCVAMLAGAFFTSRDE